MIHKDILLDIIKNIHKGYWRVFRRCRDAPSPPGRDRAIEAGNLRPGPRGSAGNRPSKLVYSFTGIAIPTWLDKKLLFRVESTTTLFGCQEALFFKCGGMPLPLLCFFHFGFMTYQKFGTKSAKNDLKMPFSAVFRKAIPSHPRSNFWECVKY